MNKTIIMHSTKKAVPGAHASDEASWQILTIVVARKVGVLVEGRPC